MEYCMFGDEDDDDDYDELYDDEMEFDIYWAT